MGPSSLPSEVVPLSFPSPAAVVVFRFPPSVSVFAVVLVPLSRSGMFWVCKRVVDSFWVSYGLALARVVAVCTDRCGGPWSEVVCFRLTLLV